MCLELDKEEMFEEGKLEEEEEEEKKICLELDKEEMCEGGGGRRSVCWRKRRRSSLQVY